MRIEPNSKLIHARQSIDGEPGIEVLSDWHHYNRGLLAMLIALTIDFDSDFLPRRTLWYVVTTNEYPNARLEFFPAKQGGISRTFPHQRLNVNTNEDQPWLGGDVCISDWYRKLNRHTHGAEIGDLLLGFQVLSLMEWLRRAAEGSLVQLGDPYELPQFTTNSSPIFAYREDVASFSFWGSCPDELGTAVISAIPNYTSERTAWTINRFLNSKGDDLKHPLLPKQPRAATFNPLSEKTERAKWVRLSEVPYLKPWHPPTTWEELRQCLGKSWSDFHRFLRAQPITRLILLGLPMPEVTGGPLVQIHWQALEIPKLMTAKDLPGWRPRERRLLLADLQRPLADDQPLSWIFSENWAQAQMSRRHAKRVGGHPNNVLLIGCGAIGSTIADLLVRGGTEKMWLCDGDIVQGGNLVRGTFEVNDIGRSKAEALKDHLRRANPNCEVWAGAMGIAYAKFRVPIRGVDWVFDCTGADDVLRHIGMAELHADAKIVSLSTTWEAVRLLAVYSPRPDFDPDRIVDALRTAHQEVDQHTSIQAEGIGCFHPAFPADPHRIALHAAAALERIRHWEEGNDRLNAEYFDVESLSWSPIAI